MKVEIWSDVVCPWCYVGKRRFEAALEGFEHRDSVEVTWRSFELDPDAPRQRDVDLATHLAQKFGTSREEAVAMQQRVVDIGADEGIGFRPDIARSGNTFDAHRVIALARERGVQDAVKERMMKAYFEQGELMSDHGTLLRLAVEAGLEASEATDVLAGDASYPPLTLTVQVSGTAPAGVTNTVTVSGGGEVNVSNDAASDVTTIVAGEAIRRRRGA